MGEFLIKSITFSNISLNAILASANIRGIPEAQYALESAVKVEAVQSLWQMIKLIRVLLIRHIS